MYKILESDIQKGILEYLEWRRILVWRTNAGSAFRSYTNKSGISKMYKQTFAPPGTSDIIGITNTGLFLAIEVKVPGKEPTEIQTQFINEINEKGGIAFVAHSIEEVQEALKSRGV